MLIRSSLNKSFMKYKKKIFSVEHQKKLLRSRCKLTSIVKSKLLENISDHFGKFYSKLKYFYGFSDEKEDRNIYLSNARKMKDFLIYESKLRVTLRP